MRRLNNVRFLCQRAEDVPSTVAPLRLVTFGNSFHWTDRTKVANAGHEPWKAALRETIDAWLGPDQKRRAVAGRLPGAPLHQDVLRETLFGEPRVVDMSDTLIGLLYSSSLQLKDVLGSRTGEFERDLRERLTRHVPNDRFEEDIEFTIISARKRTMSK